jgi:hypothetical protein
VLKKAGIIVAASAAGILAFTPLAFAGSSRGHDGHQSHGQDDKSHSVVKKEDNDVNKDNLTNDCAFGNAGGSPTAGALGGSSLLGVAAPVTSLATDVTSQLNTLNCNNINVSDLVDSDSNNSDSSSEQTSIKESFNDNGDN